MHLQHQSAITHRNTLYTALACRAGVVQHPTVRPTSRCHRTTASGTRSWAHSWWLHWCGSDIALAGPSDVRHQKQVAPAQLRCTWTTLCSGVEKAQALGKIRGQAYWRTLPNWCLPLSIEATRGVDRAARSVLPANGLAQSAWRIQLVGQAGPAYSVVNTWQACTVAEVLHAWVGVVAPLSAGQALAGGRSRVAWEACKLAGVTNTAVVEGAGNRCCAVEREVCCWEAADAAGGHAGSRDGAPGPICLTGCAWCSSKAKVAGKRASAVHCRPCAN